MSELMAKIAAHYENHRKCDLGICPMLITEYEAYQLVNDLRCMFAASFVEMPKAGDKLLFHGVQLYVIREAKE